METKKSTHGGPNRGQGRKPMIEGVALVPVSIKLSPEQKLKLARLGGAQWVRERIDKARDPES